MFATILGTYPLPVAPSGAELSVGEAIADQLEAGLQLLGDGEVWRPGSLKACRSGESPVHRWRVADALARDLGSGPGSAVPVKQCIVGPFTLGREVGGRATLDFADGLNATLRSLADAGVPVVQVHEPALSGLAVEDEGARQLAAAALARLTVGVEGLHLTLAVSGDATAAGPRLLFDAPFYSYVFDLISGPDNWRLIREAPGDRGVICCVADARVQEPDTEAVMVWAARYAAALGGRGLDRVGLAPSAGLEALPRDVARAKLAGLARAAAVAAITDPGELAAAMDPRAVSAHTGDFVGPPSARRRRPAR